MRVLLGVDLGVLLAFAAQRYRQFDRCVLQVVFAAVASVGQTAFGKLIRALGKRRMLHLTRQCDAVEELIRYAEGSQDRKLPPHPSYLEARRVQQHAQALTGQPMLAPSSQPALRTPTPQGEASNPPPSDPHEPRRPLPPMQMAKTW